MPPLIPESSKNLNQLQTSNKKNRKRVKYSSSDEDSVKQPKSTLDNPCSSGVLQGQSVPVQNQCSTSQRDASSFFPDFSSVAEKETASNYSAAQSKKCMGIRRKNPSTVNRTTYRIESDESSSLEEDASAVNPQKTNCPPSDAADSNTDTEPDNVFKSKKIRKKKKRLGISLMKRTVSVKKPPPKIIDSSDSDASIIDKTPSDKSSPNEDIVDANEENLEETNDDNFVLPLLSVHDMTNKSDSASSVASPQAALENEQIEGTTEINEATRNELQFDADSDSIFTSGSNYDSNDEDNGIKSFYNTTMFQNLNKTLVKAGVRYEIDDENITTIHDKQLNESEENSDEKPESDNELSPKSICENLIKTVGSESLIGSMHDKTNKGSPKDFIYVPTQILSENINAQLNENLLERVNENLNEKKTDSIQDSDNNSATSINNVYKDNLNQYIPTQILPENTDVSFNKNLVVGTAEDSFEEKSNESKNMECDQKQVSSGEMFKSSQPRSESSDKQSKVLFSSQSNDSNYQSRLSSTSENFNSDGYRSENSDSNPIKECRKLLTNLHLIKDDTQPCNSKFFTPAKKPPTRDEVLSDLVDYGLPLLRNPEPYYSNPKDSTGRKEIGGTVLSVKSKSIKDLEEFSSKFVSITSWRQAVSNNLFFTQEKPKKACANILTSERRVVITPLKPAPTYSDAAYWSRARALLKELDTNSSKKISQPASSPQKPVPVGKDVNTESSEKSSFGDQKEPENNQSATDVSIAESSQKSFRDNESDIRNNQSVDESISAHTAVGHSTPNLNDNLKERTLKLKNSPSLTPVQPVKRKLLIGLSKLKHVKKSVSLPQIVEDPRPIANNPAESGDVSTIKEPPPEVMQETVEEKRLCDSKGNIIASKPQVSSDPEASEKSQTSVLINSQSNQPTLKEGSVSEHLIRSEISSVSSDASTLVSPNTSLRKKLLDSQFRKELQTPLHQVTASCCIDGPSPNNSGNFKKDLENYQRVKAAVEHQYLTVLVMELHTSTRGDLRPDPDFDPIEAVFYSVVNDVPLEKGKTNETGVIAVLHPDEQRSSFGEFNCSLQFVEDEKSLIKQVVNLVRKWDPDILVGYEVEMLSWTYLIQRAYASEINLLTELSRVRCTNPKKFSSENSLNLTVSEDKEPEIRLTGRIVINFWRLLRNEVALQSYSFENIMYHVLHQRVPLHPFKNLTLWWNHRSGLYRWITVEFYLIRVEGIIKILDQLDLIGRTAELAKLFGILFYEVLSRGSQFRVESMMLRLAKPHNYVAVSPSTPQRANMRAPESLPLIMEPESRYYKDPVIVLDFQSLYPSIIIAYNYCFSTCLGRVEHLADAEIFEFGCTQLRVPFQDLVDLEDKITIAPCGSAFVHKEVRKGLLPAMLEEILDTRLMVKQSMKLHKSNKVLQRVLHSRQLGLKLIANVTYGYTAANFSGRMPAIEVGDAVVSKGRETLGRAIELVNTTEKWGSRVIYGDTDSLFVLVPGRSKEDAFKIGAEIAEAVTNANPTPVKLKLEKVYQPCILQTKKRYVGFMYESPDQDKPTYEAKGIETVRRDGCPAVAKILEKCLRLVFETSDISYVKKFVCKQFSKILTGRVSVQDVTFAREYRGAIGYKPGACVPALQLAQQWLAVDPRSEPRVCERVPYVVIAGPPGLPIIRLVRSPHELLADPSLKINAEYYITRVVIPPLDRCFSLLGVDIFKWYSELPRKAHIYLPSSLSNTNKKATISQYFATTNCVVCNEQTHSGICIQCQPKSQLVAVTLSTKINVWEKKYSNCIKVCQSCCGRPHSFDCVSLDCPVLYRKAQTCRDQEQIPFLRQLQESFLDLDF